MAKRLLLLVTDLLIGGTPTVVRELAIRLHRDGVDVQVACLGEWGPTADHIRAAGVPVTALNARGAMDMGVFGRLSSLISQQHIDVVLSFLVHANVAASIVRMRRTFTLHQSIQTTQSRPKWHWLAQGIAGLFAQQVLVPSESVAQVARRRSFTPAAKLVVIPNAVDASAFERADAGRSAGKVRVGFIGRLDPIKRIPDLLQAISFLSPEYVLAIYGAGREVSLISQRIERLGIADRVSLKGSIESPQRALAEMDILVLPSQAEGFGLVLIEAMAAGVPVVATNAPGIRDVVQDGENGILVPIGNSPALALAIRRLAKDAELRQALIEAGRRTVAERYAWGPILAQYRRVLGI